MKGRDVQVTGMGIVCANARTISGWTEVLRNGKSGITSVDKKAYNLTAAALLDEFELPVLLGNENIFDDHLIDKALTISHRSTSVVQTAIYTALCAWHQAKLHEMAVQPERVGLVIAGQNLNSRLTWNNFERFGLNTDYISPTYALQYLDTNLVGTISSTLGIRGAGFSVGGASASGNLALIEAFRMLKTEELDACLVVGALTDLSPMEIQAFKNLGAMAGDELPAAQRCRPFDKAHAGFVYGQGSAAILLEARASAEKREIKSLATLTGVGQVLDGNHLADPSEAGECRAMLQALTNAGITSDSIAYINAHGSSSSLGDKTEAQAIHKCFGAAVSNILVNSTKSFTGHCLFSAGLVEAVATVIQLQQSFVHANLNLETPIDNDIRFIDKTVHHAEIDYAMSNSFGFGGINSSIIFKRVTH